MLRAALRPACILLAFHALACAAQAPAVHRCTGHAGEPVFSDRTCAGLALPDPARDVAPGAARDRGTCATSPEQLRERVADAFRRQDAIALSGWILWQDRGTAAAADVLRDLAERVRRPLLELRLGIAESAGPFAGPGPRRDARPLGGAEGPLELEIATASGVRNADTEILQLALVPRSGCWWLERP